MGFSSKRGRPKKLKVINGGKDEVDLGTLELQKKRLQQLTAEPIDICRNKGIIDEEQHAAALHFRWLYTLKFGAAGVSAMDLNGINGREIKIFDEKWQVAREEEYASVIEKLRAAGALKVVMNIVVFNCKPRFLNGYVKDAGQLKQNALELAKLREGLNILSRLNAPKSAIRKLR